MCTESMCTEEPRPPSIGFVGLGSMGAAIAERLVGRYDVVVHDLSAAATERLVRAGATAAELPGLGAAADVVFTCLPAPADVAAVVLGPGGLAHRMRPGAVLVDMSTSSPVHDDKIVAGLEGTGVRFADAPVSGGPQGAHAGTLAIMVGAGESTFAHIEPVLRTVSRNVHHVGGVGSGHTMKLVINLMSACNRVAALEAIHLSSACGIELRTAIEVINLSGGRSYISESTYPKYLMDGDFEAQGFALGLLDKDVRLAMELADARQHPMAVGPVVERFLDEAVGRFGSGVDINQMMAQWYA
jgi:3-hydroxyisobutyrate dehydrogenase